jgi:hypothetical protein
MSYYYDTSGYLLTLSISGLTASQINILTISNYLSPKTITISGYVSNSISSYIYNVSTISGYFSGLTNFTISNLISYTTSSIIYDNYFSFLTSSNYISPFVSLSSLVIPTYNYWMPSNNFETIGNIYFNSGLSLSGIVNYNNQYIQTLSGIVYGNFYNTGNQINIINNREVNDIYSRNLNFSISNNLFSINNYYGNQVNNLITGSIDQYSRNYNYSLSGVVYSNFYNIGNQIAKCN